MAEEEKKLDLGQKIMNLIQEEYPLAFKGDPVHLGTATGEVCNILASMVYIRLIKTGMFRRKRVIDDLTKTINAALDTLSDGVDKLQKEKETDAR